VPQGRHLHVLLTRGAAALEELFPGLLADLAEAGVPMLTSKARVGLRLGGRSICRDFTFDHPFPLAGRPLLEDRVRAHLPANVAIRQGCPVAGLAFAGNRVTGVRLNDGETVPADLVVDATGRSGRTRCGCRRCRPWPSTTRARRRHSSGW
jgi:2-polyprenyl-6-methoxyphenol hydroxylase-like FAD-dependent oxidoreductase